MRAALLLALALGGCSSISGRVGDAEFSSNRMLTDLAINVTKPDGTVISYSNNPSAVALSAMAQQVQQLTGLVTRLAIGAPLVSPE